MKEQTQDLRTLDSTAADNFCSGITSDAHLVNHNYVGYRMYLTQKKIPTAEEGHRVPKTPSISDQGLFMVTPVPVVVPSPPPPAATSSTRSKRIRIPTRRYSWDSDNEKMLGTEEQVETGPGVPQISGFQTQAETMTMKPNYRDSGIESEPDSNSSGFDAVSNTLGEMERTGNPFLQNFACWKVAGLQKCRECSTETVDNHLPSEADMELCRFFNFRKLKFDLATQKLVIVGFADPVIDPTQEDKQLWLPSTTNLPNMTLETALFIQAEVGGQFRDLLKKECESRAKVAAHNFPPPKWKKKIENVRDMCDVCETTIFNYHWACTTCGFFACMSCFEERSEKLKTKSWFLDACLNISTQQRERRDNLNWLVCWTDGNRPGETGHSLWFVQCIPEAAWIEIKDWDGQVTSVSALQPISTVVDFAALGSTIKKQKLEVPDFSSEDSDSSDDVGADELSIFADFDSVYQSSAESAEVQIEPFQRQPITVTPIQLKHKRQPVTRYRSKNSSDVPHEWFCSGLLLHLMDHQNPGNQVLFHEVWKCGQPVLISGVSRSLNSSLWSPKAFEESAGNMTHELTNIATAQPFTGYLLDFWRGFENMDVRLRNEGKPMLLKLKDWPPKDDLANAFPERFKDLMESLPLPDYTLREGKYNLAARLPESFVKPDLGPKMYIAYASPFNCELGTTNLHLDMSDATNVMTYVGVPSQDGLPMPNEREALLKLIEEDDFDMAQIERVKSGRGNPGAIWHIFHKNDADKIREFLCRHAAQTGTTIRMDSDPIHDQSFYLDSTLRLALKQQYSISGYSIVQCMGDAIFIPAGAPHQVRNIRSCIKIAEDFVSPQNLANCFDLTEEFRRLSESHCNHEDKLQIKNITYHSMKDAISVLRAQGQGDSLQ